MSNILASGTLDFNLEDGLVMDQCLMQSKELLKIFKMTHIFPIVFDGEGGDSHKNLNFTWL